MSGLVTISVLAHVAVKHFKSAGRDFLMASEHPNICHGSVATSSVM